MSGTRMVLKVIIENYQNKEVDIATLCTKDGQSQRVTISADAVSNNFINLQSKEPAVFSSTSTMETENSHKVCENNNPISEYSSFTNENEKVVFDDFVNEVDVNKTTVIGETENDNIANIPILGDCEDIENYLDESFVLGKVIGTRFNDETKMDEYLIESKKCISIGYWNPFHGDIGNDFVSLIERGQIFIRPPASETNKNENILHDKFLSEGNISVTPLKQPNYVDEVGQEQSDATIGMVPVEDDYLNLEINMEEPSMDQFFDVRIMDMMEPIEPLATTVSPIKKKRIGKKPKKYADENDEKYIQCKNDEKYIQCKYCTFKTTGKSQLKIHTQIHLDKLTCSECGKRVNNQLGLAKHKITHMSRQQLEERAERKRILAEARERRQIINIFKQSRRIYTSRKNVSTDEINRIRNNRYPIVLLPRVNTMSNETDVAPQGFIPISESNSERNNSIGVNHDDGILQKTCELVDNEIPKEKCDSVSGGDKLTDRTDEYAPIHSKSESDIIADIMNTVQMSNEIIDFTTTPDIFDISGELLTTNQQIEENQFENLNLSSGILQTECSVESTERFASFDMEMLGYNISDNCVAYEKELTSAADADKEESISFLEVKSDLNGRISISNQKPNESAIVTQNIENIYVGISDTPIKKQRMSETNVQY